MLDAGLIWKYSTLQSSPSSQIISGHTLGFCTRTFFYVSNKSKINKTNQKWCPLRGAGGFYYTTRTWMRVRTDRSWTDNQTQTPQAGTRTFTCGGWVPARSRVCTLPVSFYSSNALQHLSVGSVMARPSSPGSFHASRLPSVPVLCDDMNRCVRWVDRPLQLPSANRKRLSPLMCRSLSLPLRLSLSLSLSLSSPPSTIFFLPRETGLSPRFPHLSISSLMSSRLGVHAWWTICRGNARICGQRRCR